MDKTFKEFSKFNEYFYNHQICTLVKRSYLFPFIEKRKFYGPSESLSKCFQKGTKGLEENSWRFF